MYYEERLTATVLQQGEREATAGAQPHVTREACVLPDADAGADLRVSCVQACPVHG